ncbi:hypothetical protein P691DRAFT_811731 [Macrolepiota fuliginosa MF-IS2]|uniref:Uncharacterized protein n=1 Tax=Macrolepiota fuliginosa MF-IS2 TaxID=1400762 RepID=A0A9P6C6E8_9AGAR|nr:hypothetical protein P691DRAFT_811731 [Macrolepiota fuliginosa MF-IS2]
MNNDQAGGMSPLRMPVPPIPVVAASSSQNSRRSSHSSSMHSRRSLKSLDRLLGDDRDPRKLQNLVHKLYEQLKFEKDRADYADRRASEAVSYLKSICEEKLRALRDISRLEEELKLYKIQYDEAQKEIFRAQAVLDEVDEKRFRAEKEAAEARSNARKMRDEVNVMRAQEEGRREGLQEGFRKGREMGYQEGLQMAQAEMERVARPRATSQGPTEVERPASRMRTMNPITEPQPPQHGHSRAPSNAPSRPPTAPPETSTSTIAPQGPSVTSHTIPEIPEEPEVIRPRSFRAPSPSPRMPISAIPPDNYIPHLGEDNRIHLPPPFELSRPPPTPERVQSPALQGFAENEEPRMIPPILTNVRMTHRRRSNSPGSASTTVSQMGMLADPYYDTGTPMSAIPEVPSPEASPEAQDATNLRRQPSLSAQSVKLMTPGPNEHIYTRPRSTSGGSSISFQPPPVIPETNIRASMSSTSTAPGITVQAPVH